MSARNLDKLFSPQSVVMIGASARPGSLGAVLAHNVLSSFKGSVNFVHPKAIEIEGRAAFASVKSLGSPPDLAVIATPPDSVAPLISELGAIGTKAAVVITAGFGEGSDAQGHRRRQDILTAAQPNDLRIVGPNCLGVILPHVALNASFSHIMPKPGDLAFISQSGALVTAMVDWAAPRDIGFSAIVSMGDKADVDFSDMLRFLGEDDKTRAILLYVEALKHPEKFMEAARETSQRKPIVVIKSGRHDEAAKAAASHTGALAGSDQAYDAAFRRSGLVRVDTLEELFDVAELLSARHQISGDRLGIITNGGGFGVLGVDALIERGGQLSSLSPSTIETLNKVLPPTWSGANPIDIIGDAPSQRYEDAMGAVLDDPAIDAVMVMNCPTALNDSNNIACSVLKVAETSEKPVLAVCAGDVAGKEARKTLQSHQIPTFSSPEPAVAAFMHLVEHRQHLAAAKDQTKETDAGPRDAKTVRSIFDMAAKENRALLMEHEAKAVFAAYGIPVNKTFVVRDADEAAEKACQIDGPVALKILSPDVVHKSDHGGVLLDLKGAESVREGAGQILKRIGAAFPNARKDGLVIQDMVRRPGAYELIAGAAVDPTFGHVLMFGHGGTAVEAIGDVAMDLVPLTRPLARHMMERTLIHRRLRGFRSEPPVDLHALEDVLLGLSRLLEDFPEIRELDINPILADADGVMAIDGRLGIRWMQTLA